jgi:ubiquinol oxidase
MFDNIPDMSARPDPAPSPALDLHKAPESLSDRIALGVVKFMRVFADAFFSRRYGHRAVVLETVAAVPGMVGGLLQHLKALRHIREDQGWIRELLDEAENERMHLMTFIHIARPSLVERGLIMVGQAVFFNAYFFLYLFAPKTAHRVVGYLEEEAVVSYTGYLAQVDSGAVDNVPAPQIARDYWNLPADARLREVIMAVRADEAKHRDINHGFADVLAAGGAPRPAGQPLAADQEGRDLSTTSRSPGRPAA